MSDTWVEKQSDAVARIEGIRRLLAGKMLDGQDVDVSELIEAETELSLLHSAEGEELRRRQDLSADAENSRRQLIRRKIIQRLREREQAIEAAELSATMLAESLQALFKLNADICKALANVSLPQPIALQPLDTKLRASVRLSLILGKAVGWDFSAVKFKPVGGERLPDGSRPSMSWVEADAQQVDITKILKGF